MYSFSFIIISISYFTQITSFNSLLFDLKTFSPKNNNIRRLQMKIGYMYYNKAYIISLIAECCLGSMSAPLPIRHTYSTDSNPTHSQSADVAKWNSRKWVHMYVHFKSITFISKLMLYSNNNCNNYLK